MAIAKAGERAAAGAALQLEQMKQRQEQGGEEANVRNVRRRLRKWLQSSPEGKEVEARVKALLGQGGSPPNSLPCYH